MKKVLIAGGSGLVGNALSNSLSLLGFDVSILSRRKLSINRVTTYEWNPSEGHINMESIKDKDYVINLAGANIGESVWTKKRKETIQNSRINSTLTLIKAINESDNFSGRLITASAVGFYGDRPEEILTEKSEKGQGFLSMVSAEWESTVQSKLRKDIPYTILRFGHVLSDKGGLLPAFTAPFKLNASVLFGNGHHYMPWIHIEDLTSVFVNIISNKLKGELYNCTSPNPVTQKEFNQTIQKVMKKRTLSIKIPKNLIKLSGDMKELFLEDQRVIPQRLTNENFLFKYPDLKLALNNLIRGQ